MQETLLWFPVEEVPGEVVGPGLLGQVDSGLTPGGGGRRKCCLMPIATSMMSGPDHLLKALRQAEQILVNCLLTSSSGLMW